MGLTVLPATHTSIYEWNEPYMQLLSSRRASQPFGWYSFPISLRVGGWVGPGEWLHIETVYPRN